MDPLTETAIVLDVGSGNCRCGFDDQEKPTFITRTSKEEKLIPNFLRIKPIDLPSFPRPIRPHYPNIIPSIKSDEKLCFVGRDYLDFRRFSPQKKLCFANGRISDLEEAEKLFINALTQVSEKKNYQDHPLVFTESPVTSLKDRVRSMEILFEGLGIRELCIGLQPQFAVFSHGSTTGLVLDIGEQITHVTPIYNFQAKRSATIISFFGGRIMTENLGLLMGERGYDDFNVYHFYYANEIMKDVKEKCCVLLNKDSTMDWGNLMYWEWEGRCEHEYELPDGSKITIGEEAQRIPECMFRRKTYKNPDLPFSFFGEEKEPYFPGQELQNYGISKLCLDSLELCEQRVRKLLLENIVLSGGSTRFESFRDRLKKELFLQANGFYRREMKDLVSKEDDFVVKANEDGELKNWIGGAIFSCTNSGRIEREEKFVTKKEYDDLGATGASLRKWRFYSGESEERLRREDLETRIGDILPLLYGVKLRKIRLGNGSEVCFYRFILI